MPPKEPLPLVPVGPCKVRALYSWSGESKQDLGFVEGDLIEVISTGDGDWWTGRLKRNKMVGLFPRNFVEFVDPNQATSLHPDVAHLAIVEPLQVSTSSTTSAQSRTSNKSTEEVLRDISMEINEMSARLKTLDTKPSDLNLQNVHGDYNGSFGQSFDDNSFDASYDKTADLFHTKFGDRSIDQSIDSFPEVDEAPPPVPPPHRILTSPSMNNSLASHTTLSTSHNRLSVNDADLMAPVTTSPDLEEVPFDPRAFAPTGSGPRPGTRAVSGSTVRSQSFDFGDMTRVPTNASIKTTSKTPGGFVKRLFKGTTFESGFSNMGLRRSASSGSRNSQSSSNSRVKRTIMSTFKPFADAFKLDTDLYPTNNYTTYDDRTHNQDQDRRAQKEATNALLDPKWMDSQRDLYRTKTITDHELQQRRRAMELQGVSSVEPFTVLAKSSVESYDFNLENFDHVDRAILSMSTWPQLMTPAVLASSRIGRQFQDSIERVRAVFLLCAVHIAYDSPSHFGLEEATASTVTRTMQTKRADPYVLAQVVKEMCDGLNIQSKVVKGHYRPPDGSSNGMIHAWNAVNVDGEWRILDASAASPTFPGAITDDINTFYFMMPPHHAIFTHVANEPADQLLIPSLPTSVIAALPVASPLAFKLGIVAVNYFAGITHMSDLEACEIVMAVPNGQIDLVAEVVTQDGNKGPALAQPLWTDNERRFRIKALLPEGSSKGTLFLYAVDRTASNSGHSEQDLVYTFPLWHRGHNAKFEFLARYASPQAIRHDVYVKEPQCRQLKGGQSYTFLFDQHPSKGVTAGSGLVPVRIAIQSPSGRVTNLVKRGTDVSDTWKTSIRTLEVGTWRAVVSVDDGEGWAAFAEWTCI